ncbi:hypothetical protein DFH09DRAFT_1081556 [Mycena vulgaris]|nr:hypothetical protein DFH09DRAFT_1081556 [Mycena vulgaris]
MGSNKGEAGWENTTGEKDIQSCSLSIVLQPPSMTQASAIAVQWMLGMPSSSFTLIRLVGHLGHYSITDCPPLEGIIDPSQLVRVEEPWTNLIPGAKDPVVWVGLDDSVEAGY